MHDKAIRFEKLGLSKTVLLFDSNRLLAYFAVCIKTFNFPDSLSKTQRKKLNGGFSKHSSVPTILIGQLGKNDNFASEITGDKIMDMCLDHISKGQVHLGGRFYLLECVEALTNFYETHYFKKLDKSADGLITMIREIIS